MSDPEVQPSHQPVPGPAFGPPSLVSGNDQRCRFVAGLVVPFLDGVVLVVALLTVSVFGSTPGWANVLLTAVIAIPLLVSGEAAPSRLTLSVLDEIPRILSLVGIAVLLVAPLGLATNAEHGLIGQATVSAIAMIAARGCSYGLIRWARRRRALVDRAVVLGAGVVGTEVERILGAHPEFGVEVIGFIDGPSVEGGPPLLGDVSSLEEIVLRDGIRRVIVAYGRWAESELVGVLRRLALLDVEVHLVPRFFDIGVAPAGRHVDDLRGIPLYHAPRAGRHRRSMRGKRLLDVMVSSTCLLLGLPLLALLAAAVRVSSPGGALFRQRRTGQDGREFRLLKLRSLRPLSRQEEKAPLAETMTSSGLRVQAARRRDVLSRRTTVGEFVRRTSLDELPQLWNVLVGDMSLVGPRPEEVRYVEEFSHSVPGYCHRHRLPVGLTGWAQVNGLRGPTSIAERARFDNHYIEHWSLWRDIVILIRTAGAVSRSIIGPRNDLPILEVDQPKTGKS